MPNWLKTEQHLSLPGGTAFGRKRGENGLVWGICALGRPVLFYRPKFTAKGECMCQVVNFKQYGSVEALNQAFGKRWVYIGRANAHAGLPASPLANPFKVRDFGGRGQTLPHYRRWLWQRIQAGDKSVIDVLQAVNESSVLVCWCKPGPCHADVIKAAADWLCSQAVS
jgi:hypothetical protein